MNLVFVTSSNVSAIGYQDGVLEVHFRNGYVYQYLNTSQSLHLQAETTALMLMLHIRIGLMISITFMMMIKDMQKSKRFF